MVSMHLHKELIVEIPYDLGGDFEDIVVEDWGPN